MDPYQGSVFYPVSLHKYLYDNANPVMCTDPTGYFSFSEITITQTINSILQKIPTINYMKVLNFINTAATVYDVTVTAINDLMNGEDLLDVAAGIVRGFTTGILLNKACAIKSVQVVLLPILTIIGGINQVESIFEAIENEDYDLAAVRTVQLIIDIISLTQSCFTGDTLVSTEDGSKRIDEIIEGDYVWAENIETGEKELKKVLEVYEKETDTLVHLVVNGILINTTENHPFYVEGKGFVAAEDLEIGDRLRSKDGNELVVEEYSVEKLEESIKVYNLDVEDHDNYYVADVEVLVHNYGDDGVDNTKPITDPSRLLEAPKEAADHHLIPAFRGKSKPYADFIKQRGINVDDFTITVSSGKGGQHMNFIHGKGKWNQK